MTHALLVIDIQNDYFAGGRMPLDGAAAAAANAARLLAAWRDSGRPVFHVQHISVRPGASFFLPDTDGVRIHAAVAPGAGEAVIRKHFPNAFRATALEQMLRAQGVTHLTIAGMMTHMCVDATTRAAADLGFESTLAHDACATRALGFGGVAVPAAQVHASFVAALDGAYARARATDSIIAGPTAAAAAHPEKA